MTLVGITTPTDQKKSWARRAIDKVGRYFSVEQLPQWVKSDVRESKQRELLYKTWKKLSLALATKLSAEPRIFIRILNMDTLMHGEALPFTGPPVFIGNKLFFEAELHSETSQRFKPTRLVLVFTRRATFELLATAQVESFRSPFWIRWSLVFDQTSGQLSLRFGQKEKPIVLLDARRLLNMYVMKGAEKYKMFKDLHEDYLVQPCPLCEQFEAVEASVEFARRMLAAVKKHPAPDLVLSPLRVQKSLAARFLMENCPLRSVKASSDGESYRSISEVAFLSPSRFNSLIALVRTGTNQLFVTMNCCLKQPLPVFERSPFVDINSEALEASKAGKDYLEQAGKIGVFSRKTSMPSYTGRSSPVRDRDADGGALDSDSDSFDIDSLNNDRLDNDRLDNDSFDNDSLDSENLALLSSDRVSSINDRISSSRSSGVSTTSSGQSHRKRNSVPFDESQKSQDKSPFASSPRRGRRTLDDSKKTQDWFPYPPFPPAPPPSRSASPSFRSASLSSRSASPSFRSASLSSRSASLSSRSASLSSGPFRFR